jgi:drug/metabolite transporter (DMT)-like permease
MEKKNLALIWVIIQVILTAGLILLTKYVFDLGIEPLNFSYQILFSSVVYLLIYALIKEPKALISVDKKSLLTIVLIGIIGSAIAYGLGFLGLQKSTATNYTFLTQTTVFFTTFLAFFFLKEHLKPYKTVLIFALLLGAYLISTNGELALPKAGDLYILLGAIAFSVGVILAKIALKKVPTLTFSMYRALFGGLSLLVFLFIINKVTYDFSWHWIAIVGLVVAIGIYAMNKVLEYGSASYMQMMSMSTPVITAFFAYLILGESMTPIQMVGGTLIIVSGFFVHKLKI